jgi:hypothetical protein
MKEKFNIVKNLEHQIDDRSSVVSIFLPEPENSATAEKD